tara:strand:- start:343 stop:552 length:210 start_codon:yes stop_codon:yes gene_type:complete
MSFLNNIFKSKDVSFTVGQRIYSKVNGSVCSIKREIKLNNIKHYEIRIENDVTRREIILSEHALRANYK